MRLSAFFGLLLRRGRTAYKQNNFSLRREQALREAGIPHPPENNGWQRPKKWLQNSAVLRALIAEAAFLKRSLRDEGRHLPLVEKGICYVRIPRAASTSIMSSILQIQLPRIPVKGMAGEHVNFLADSYVSKRLKAEEKDCLFFTVVRNPFARIVSVYRTFLEGPSKDFIYDDYLLGIIHKACSFRDFVKVVWCIPDSLKDQHIKPQTQLLEFYSRRRIPVEVFKLEQPQAVRNFLLQAGLDLEPLDPSRAPYDYREYFDPETVRLVADIYASDITAFGYEPISACLTEFTVRK